MSKPSEAPSASAEDRLHQYEAYIRIENETLELIAQHGPLARTLETICDLVEHSLPGASALVIMTDPIYPLRIFSQGSFPEPLIELLVARATAALDRIEILVDDAGPVIVEDPASEGRAVSCYPVIGLGSVPLGALCISRDVGRPSSDRVSIFVRHASRLVQVAIEQHLAERRIIDMLASERKQIAADLHDDPVQAVTAVSLILQRLALEVPTDQADLLGQARNTVNSAIERMRRMLFELHPTALEEEGLAVAVEVYLEETFEGLGIAWQVQDTMERDPSPHLAALAYRLIHDTLSNVVAHAKASSVRVELGSRDDGLRIRIEDDGVGFEPAMIPRARPGHLGIHTAQDLARRASGTMEILSAPGTGCTVDIWIPNLIH